MLSGNMIGGTIFMDDVSVTETVPVPGVFWLLLSAIIPGLLLRRRLRIEEGGPLSCLILLARP